MLRKPSTYPGWEGEVVTFKKGLRIPSKLINVSRPRDTTAALVKTNNETTSKVIDRRKRKSSSPPNRSHKRQKRCGGSSSSFAWNRRWNYFMFRTSMLFLGRRSSSQRKLKRKRKEVVALPSVPATNDAVKGPTKTRLRNFRRRFRSGFDYIRKKKKNGSQSNVSKRPKVTILPNLKKTKKKKSFRCVENLEESNRMLLCLLFISVIIALFN